MSNFTTQFNDSNALFMLDTLITSKTRIKLLLKFFLNSNARSYLRGLESEFGESSNAIRLELNRFEDAGLLKAEVEGNKKMFRANTGHPLYEDIHNIILKYIGLDQIVEKVARKLGKVVFVFLTGDFAKGKDSSIIDLIFVGDHINKEYLIRLVEKAETLIRRRIRYLVYTVREFNGEFDRNRIATDLLLLWKAENSAE